MALISKGPEAIHPPNEPDGIQLPNDINIGTFQLTIHNLDFDEGEQVSNRFRRDVSDKFEELNPTLSILYELVIDEEEVWEGSRKSRNKVRLKRKRNGNFIQRIKSAAVAPFFILGLFSIDYDVVEKNFESTVHFVQENLSKLELDLDTSDFEYDREVEGPPFSRRKYKKKSKRQ